MELGKQTESKKVNTKDITTSALSQYQHFHLFLTQSAQVTLNTKSSTRYNLDNWVLYDENLGRIASGLYFYRVVAKGKGMNKIVKQKKMMLIK